MAKSKGSASGKSSTSGSTGKAKAGPSGGSAKAGSRSGAASSGGQTGSKQSGKATGRSTSSKPASAGEPVITLSHDQIAQKAYEIWLAKGRPTGRDDENWREAESALQQQA